MYFYIDFPSIAIAIKKDLQNLYILAVNCYMVVDGVAKEVIKATWDVITYWTFLLINALKL